MKDFFGNQLAGSAILAFNSAHNFEQYGNLVTYMRLNGINPLLPDLEAFRSVDTQSVSVQAMEAPEGT